MRIIYIPVSDTLQLFYTNTAIGSYNQPYIDRASYDSAVATSQQLAMQVETLTQQLTSLQSKYDTLVSSGSTAQQVMMRYKAVLQDIVSYNVTYLAQTVVPGGQSRSQMVAARGLQVDP